MFINAGVLFNLAKAAYERTKAASSDREPLQMDAIVAVVFSVVALEAFINEAIELAGQPATPGFAKEQPSVIAFSSIGKEAEERQSSIGLKFMLAHVTFTGKTYPTGEKPYQEFALLLNLRNALIHYKSLDRFLNEPRGGVLMEPPRVLEKLRSKNILAEFDAGTMSSWINSLSTRAVARWACNTAVEMVQSVLKAVPEGEFKDKLDFFYTSSFLHMN